MSYGWCEWASRKLMFRVCGRLCHFEPAGDPVNSGNPFVCIPPHRHTPPSLGGDNLASNFIVYRGPSGTAPSCQGSNSCTRTSQLPSWDGKQSWGLQGCFLTSLGCFEGVLQRHYSCPSTNVWAPWRQVFWSVLFSAIFPAPGTLLDVRKYSINIYRINLFINRSVVTVL